MSRRNVLILVVVIILILAGVVWYYKSISGGVVRAPGSQCIDSDGDDPYTKGEVTYMENTFEDKCSSLATLSEQYCKQSVRDKKWYPAAKDVSCVGLFEGGGECVDGACIKRA